MYCHPELHITAAARLQLAAAGFSTRFVNGILSGCVPVVFFPFVAMPWDSVLDFDTFALRVNESVFMNGLDAYLASISPQRIWELQDGVECVWRYFSWSSIWGQLDDEGGSCWRCCAVDCLGRGLHRRGVAVPMRLQSPGAESCWKRRSSV